MPIFRVDSVDDRSVPTQLPGKIIPLHDPLLLEIPVHLRERAEQLHKAAMAISDAAKKLRLDLHRTGVKFTASSRFVIDDLENDAFRLAMILKPEAFEHGPETVRQEQQPNSSRGGCSRSDGDPR